MSYCPVLIIGAGRSGTNMLRDVLTSLPKVGTWPCDEINYIWRHGNRDAPTDEFDATQATPEVQRFVRAAFARLARKGRFAYVVEKTCANSLRIPFIHRILPDARYIFIVRDPRDVVASAMKRWRAALDLPYILRKARYVPLTDFPYYGLRYARDRLFRLRSPENRLACWGPRFKGMRDMLQRASLAEVCTAQWARCVSQASADLATIDQSRVCRLSYESFVREPLTELRRLLDFLAIEVAESDLADMAAGISTANIGKWRRDLDDRTVVRIESLAAEVMVAQGYRPVARVSANAVTPENGDPATAAGEAPERANAQIN